MRYPHSFTDCDGLKMKKKSVDYGKLTIHVLSVVKLALYALTLFSNILVQLDTRYRRKDNLI